MSASQINLAWTASTDNVAVTGYRVERCLGAACANFVQVATPTGASFNDTGLAAATTYRYRVRAADAVPNLSGYSSIQNATTQAGPDTQPPTAPTGLSATPVSATQINLAWTASTDNVAVTGYRVERCLGAACANFVQVGTPTGASFNDTGLAGGDHVQVPGAGRRRGPQPERLLDRRERDDAAAAGYAGADGADRVVGDGGVGEPDQFGLDGVDRQRGGDRLPG